MWDETCIISVLQIEQHFLDGKEVQDGVKDAEQSNRRDDDGDDSQERHKNQNRREETWIGVQTFCRMLAVDGFAQPAFYPVESQIPARKPRQ